MSTNTVSPKQEIWGWISFLLKLTFWIAAFFIVIFTVMANMGGSSDTLRESIEGFISESTGYQAKVGKLNNMSFFPDVTFDFAMVEMYRKEITTPVVTAGKVQVAFGFWDVMARTGEVKAINIESVEAMPGVLLKDRVSIHHISILDATDGPRFEAVGSVGAHDFEITAGMNVTGSGRRKEYSFGEERAFDIKIEDMLLHTSVRAGDKAGIVFDNFSLVEQEKKIMEGRIEMVRNPGRIDFTGKITMNEHKSDVLPSLVFNLPDPGQPLRLEGGVESTEFHVEDFAEGAGYARFMTMLESMFAPPGSTIDSTLTLKAGTLYRAGASTGAYAGLLPIKGWRVDADALGRSSP
ncbi:MAG: hypothetical protein WBK77_05690 [Alphaproteobacteria bacterium]